MLDQFNEIANKLKMGDRRAGELIFDHFSPQIFRFFMVRTLNRETAQDLTQEVFLKVIDKIQTFNGALGSFSGWLWQIAKNTAKDYYRKKKPVPLSDEILAIKERSDFLNRRNDPTPAIKMAEITDLVKGLSEEEQEVFTLHYLSDLPYRDISRATGRSESSLRVLIHRVNKKIRNLIKKS